MRRFARMTAVALYAWLATAAPPARATDLAQALRDVAAGSPTLAARRAMAEAARRRVTPAGSWASPMVEVGAVNVPATGRFDTDMMTMKMVGVTQRVPLFGSNRLAARAARAGATAAAAGVETTRNELLGMGLEAYADAWFAAALGREAEAHIGVLDRMVQSARARYAAGNGRLDDVLRSEAERASAVADVEDFRAEERGARARLDALRGVTPGGPADTLAAVATAGVPADPAVWIAAVTDSQPRLREMAGQVSRYRFAARAARRALWPDLELRGSYGWRRTLVGGMEQDNMVSASVGFMVPLFAGRELSEGAEMDAMARASEAERRAARLALEEQVAGTHAAAAAAQRSVHLYADTVVAVQRRAVEASWVSYSAGATDLWRVFESSHALYNEEVALLRARQRLVRAQARMLSLTGRGDLIGVALPTPGEEP